MAGMESIEKLREWLHADAYEHPELMELVDEIEREIAERYMERPCDKNGEPTYVGQRIKHRGHEGEVWLIGVHEVMCSDRVCYPCGEYVHVKPRTVEDVLNDFAKRVLNSGHQWGLDAEETTAKYADELREMAKEGEL